MTMLSFSRSALRTSFRACLVALCLAAPAQAASIDGCAKQVRSICQECSPGWTLSPSKTTCLPPAPKPKPAATRPHPTPPPPTVAPPAPPPKRETASSCPTWKVPLEDAEGAVCCWPGQSLDAVSRSCSGTPLACPPGLSALPEGCVCSAQVAMNQALAAEQGQHWLEALDRYQKLSQWEVRPGAAEECETRMQQEARANHQQLEARIPQVMFVLQGLIAQQVRLMLDGRELSPSQLAEGLRLDPGSHTLQAVDATTVRITPESFVLQPSTTQRVIVMRQAAPPASADPATPSASNRPMEDTRQPLSTQRTIGLGSAIVGAGGIALGAIAGGLALSTKSALEDSSYCAGTTCAPEERDQVDKLNTWRTVSTVGFFGGAALVATGVALWFTDSGRAETAKAHLTPWIGLGAVGAEGRF